MLHSEKPRLPAFRTPRPPGHLPALPTRPYPTLKAIPRASKLWERSLLGPSGQQGSEGGGGQGLCGGGVILCTVVGWGCGGLGRVLWVPRAGGWLQGDPRGRISSPGCRQPLAEASGGGEREVIILRLNCPELPLGTTGSHHVGLCLSAAVSGLRAHWRDRRRRGLQVRWEGPQVPGGGAHRHSVGSQTPAPPRGCMPGGPPPPLLPGPGGDASMSV